MSIHAAQFYNSQPEKEWKRLLDPYARLEFVCTMYLINKYFPKSGSICDIGGGPGRYSFELAKQGYEITLVDMSSELLDIAKQEMQNQKIQLKKIMCADAQDLREIKSHSFDAVLLLGPLYHLLTRGERLKALSEAYRVLKTGGIAIIAYLNGWGIIRYGLSRFPARFEDIEFIKAMQNETVLKESFETFTECYWSTPPKAMAEIQSVGFTVTSHAGCESFASGMKVSIRDMAEKYPQAYENVLMMSKELCEAVQYRDTTEHIHFIVQK